MVSTKVTTGATATHKVKLEVFVAGSIFHGIAISMFVAAGKGKQVCSTPDLIVMEWTEKLLAVDNGEVIMTMTRASSSSIAIV